PDHGASSLASSGGRPPQGALPTPWGVWGVGRTGSWNPVGRGLEGGSRNRVGRGSEGGWKGSFRLPNLTRIEHVGRPDVDPPLGQRPHLDLARLAGRKETVLGILYHLPTQMLAPRQLADRVSEAGRSIRVQRQLGIVVHHLPHALEHQAINLELVDYRAS